MKHVHNVHVKSPRYILVLGKQSKCTGVHVHVHVSMGVVGVHVHVHVHVSVGP